MVPARASTCSVILVRYSSSLAAGSISGSDSVQTGEPPERIADDRRAVPPAARPPPGAAAGSRRTRRPRSGDTAARSGRGPARAPAPPAPGRSGAGHGDRVSSTRSPGALRGTKTARPSSSSPYAVAAGRDAEDPHRAHRSPSRRARSSQARFACSPFATDRAAAGPRLVLRQRGGNGQVDRLALRQRRCQEVGAAVEELDVDGARPEGGIGQQPPMEAHVGADPGDHQLVQGTRHPVDGLEAGRGPDDELGEQRVVEQADLVARFDPAVPAHPGAARGAQVLDPAGGGQEPVGGILAGDPALHGPAPRVEPARGHAHRLPGGDPELLPHQIHAVDQLGHRVLDLDPGVHLEEVEAAVRGEEELAGAGAEVAHCLGRGDGSRAHPLADLRRDRDRGRLLHQLLVPALDRALALAQVHGALPVGEHLDLHVAGRENELFQVHAGIAEGLPRLRRGGLQRRLQLLGLVHHPHALASAAGRRLHQHGVAELPRQRERRAQVAHRLLPARHDRNVGLPHPPPGLGLVAHGPDGGGGRADEDETGVHHRLGERRALGQEAVAGVHRVGTGALSRLEQSLDHEIALARRGRSDRHREIGGADVRRGPVGCGVDGDRLETFFVTRADDAKSDFAAIGDQHPLHGAQAAGGVSP